MSRGLLILSMSFFCVHASADRETAMVAQHKKTLAECRQNKDDCAFAILNELLTVYRPSDKEGKAADHLVSFVEAARKKNWGRKKIAVRRDEMHNVVVDIPATGNFKENAPKICLQAHQDMVLAVQGAPAGTDLHPYFTNGVETEIKDGWLQSLGQKPTSGNDQTVRKTSIGTDNTIGVAMALQFLALPDLAHPPLQMVFTTQEETGLFGAEKLKFSLNCNAMINLDAMFGNATIVLTQGGLARKFSGKVSANLPASQAGVTSFFEISLKSLAGGHSGKEIHKNKLSGVKALAWTLSTLLKSGDIDFEVVEALSGNISVPNKISDSMLLKIVVKSARNSSWKDNLTQKVRTFVAGFADDNVGGFEFSITEKTHDGSPLVLLPAGIFGPFAEKVLALFDQPGSLAHGVLTTDDKLPNKVKTSSNLAHLGVNPQKNEMSALIMARSFDDDEMNQKGEEIVKLVSSVFEEAPLVTKTIDIPAWMAPTDSWLLKLAVDKSGFYRDLITLQGGIEPSVFQKKYPDMPIIAVGANVKDNHTAAERMEVDSFNKSSLALRSLVVDIGNAPEFLAKRKPSSIASKKKALQERLKTPGRFVDSHCDGH